MSTRLAPHRAALLAVLGLLASLALVALPARPAAAADLSRFDPGLIISDALFYDSRTMSAGAVQSFLDTKGARCVPAADGTPCLRQYTESTSSRAADARCTKPYQGAANESAAQIITKVAEACGINPQVILATLQKEQGLVTASGSSLTPTRYRSAMGFGCPDTAACNSLYYGFFNQVYSAASQLRNYANNPTRYSHRAGQLNNVRYHPNSACGTSPVFIQNQATASLYNYTPYQPNGAALAAGYGTGDGCSSYGNRNFWNYFTDWFGPTVDRLPTGFLDSVTTTSESITVSGWALDLDTSASIPVHVWVGPASYAFVADGERPDLVAPFQRGSRHGFTATVPATPGTWQVCVYAINDWGGGGNALIACRSVTVANASPTGFLDSVTTSASGTITASGWALDPDTTASIPVHMYVGTASKAFLADAPRADIAAAFGKGDKHGFTATAQAPPGTHQVCLWAINATAGPNTMLGCRQVTVPSAAPNAVPTGFLDSVTANADGTITAAGWTLDPDTTAPLTVEVAVDGTTRTYLANGVRKDVGAAFGKGDNHGFVLTFPALPGSRSVCVRAKDATTADTTLLGCRTVTVVSPLPDRAPTGFLDSVTVGASGTVTASGWALDPDTTDPIPVHMYVDSASTAFLADAVRTDVGAAFGMGDKHGFTTSMTASPGTRSVCLWAINTGGGANTHLGCRTVTVPQPAVNQAPTGFLDSVTVNPDGTVTASGWALDPDTTDPIPVHMYVDTASSAFLADTVRTDVGAAFGKGDKHGFTTTMPAAPGSRNVCVWAINTTAGSNTMLGCRTVTVG
ncbi:hypothetical protein [Cellulomonas fimi]|uniref:Hemagglutinin-related protein n=1 Tax=Cellulomonas fimi (strain ATCC 484 / DSM 20113 / JCM 1341 / CCUG 24087 / LMG 16345 / NBRC 15513 / NCIMB 8980 / NCTC 7547 / NRS-133) TaxID=590998 RepID=F4H4E9_CELFA|nr:hypothetical protein [Cellulomonas fimi]AEE46625.1 hypothetical protein Celf_2499 [Cellulomonas fimi ATCC 484]NNH08344.1 hypothetical protein [Cellulomonas fimi]VEH33696.1 Cellulose binding domain [Cellulomonas fimi]